MSGIVLATGVYLTGCTCRHRQEFRRGDRAPRCPRCGVDVHWSFVRSTFTPPPPSVRSVEAQPASDAPPAGDPCSKDVSSANG
jgi:hypothetical protein